jgi:spore coat polysaccharide biosynthesis protein SpsF (cytidylyltransferase family)
VVGIFFIARLGSTRLERKHLISVNGKTFIEWLVERFEFEFQEEINRAEIKLFITTSIRNENQEFETLFKESETEVFFGNDENIPMRQLECAKYHHISHIISIDGDDILCSTSAARLVYQKLSEHEGIVKTVGLPLGMNVIGYSTECLKKSLSKNENFKLETGWDKIFENSEINIIRDNRCGENESLRMTLDYTEDAIFFKSIIKFVGTSILSIPDSELVEIIKNNAFDNANSFLIKEYWINFNKKKKLDI